MVTGQQIKPILRFDANVLTSFISIAKTLYLNEEKT